MVYVYYETIEGDAGLATLDEDGLREHPNEGYGTEYVLEWDSLSEFVRNGGVHYPDGYIRFKVLQGTEVGPEEWSELDGAEDEPL
jgi:hypothetical protein